MSSRLPFLAGVVLLCFIAGLVQHHRRPDPEKPSPWPTPLLDLLHVASFEFFWTLDPEERLCKFCHNCWSCASPIPFCRVCPGHLVPQCEGDRAETLRLRCAPEWRGYFRMRGLDLDCPSEYRVNRQPQEPPALLPAPPATSPPPEAENRGAHRRGVLGQPGKAVGTPAAAVPAATAHRWPTVEEQIREIETLLDVCLLTPCRATNGRPIPSPEPRKKTGSGRS